MWALTLVFSIVLMTVWSTSTAKPIETPVTHDGNLEWVNQLVEAIRHDPTKKAILDEHMRKYYARIDPFQRNGINGFHCDQGHTSKSVPTTVHSLRPGDIRIVAAMGDSLTAGNGALANTILGVLTQFRGQVFDIGGATDLSEHITISNIMKSFNPSLDGFSVGSGSWKNYRASQMNVGIPGSVAPDMPSQARALVKRLKAHPEVGDFENDWKMVFLFVGGNDMCAYCRKPDLYSPEKYAGNIREAIKIIHDNVPKVLFNLMGTFHLEMLRKVTAGENGCQLIHIFECPCASDVASFSDEQFSQLSYAYRDHLHAMVNAGEFEKDDFTIVIQTFAEDTLVPPLTPNGEPDVTFFAPDCFHFSGKGHDKVAQGVWKNMLEPVGHKTTRLNLTVTEPQLDCPPQDCPFIRTSKNSEDCKKYLDL